MSPRPPELETKLKETTELINQNIIDVLVLFESGNLKNKKITAKIVAEKAGCSEGAINLRKWATERIKRIKTSKIDEIRDRLSEALIQNALLYEEVLISREKEGKYLIENKELGKINSNLLKELNKFKKQSMDNLSKDKLTKINKYSQKEN